MPKLHIQTFRTAIMIVGRFGQILPILTHDHETAPSQGCLALRKSRAAMTSRPAGSRRKAGAAARYREALPRRRHRGSVRARRRPGIAGEATPETSDHRGIGAAPTRQGGVVLAQRPAGSRWPPGSGSWPSRKRSASSRTARPRVRPAPSGAAAAVSCGAASAQFSAEAGGPARGVAGWSA